MKSILKEIGVNQSSDFVVDLAHGNGGFISSVGAYYGSPKVFIFDEYKNLKAGEKYNDVYSYDCNTLKELEGIVNAIFFYPPYALLQEHIIPVESFQDLARELDKLYIYLINATACLWQFILINEKIMISSERTVDEKERYLTVLPVRAT